jgi:ribosomal protein S18 acetylase RimI-like enzyme
MAQSLSADADRPAHVAIPTTQYTDAELADIYSRARTDYIVPMPMNARRIREYIDQYDIDLSGSCVAVDPDDKELNGIIMLGIREERGWITRLGVLPERRRRRVGQFLMDRLIANAQARDITLIQLEVIKGNDPAHKLFVKYGFKETRDLLVIRRAPHELDASQHPTDGIQVSPIEADFETYLANREPGASWVEETASLLNMTGLYGYTLTLPDGEAGWIIFQRSALQLQHIVMNPDASETMMRALLSQVHFDNPKHDTKVENLPEGHPTWPIFEAFGYVISFQRIEMVLTF